MKTKLYSLLFCTFMFYFLQAQHRFEGGLVAGVNLAELVDGGSLDSHVGFNVGGKIVSPMSRHWQWSMEMLYSQQADYLPHYRADNLEKFKINWLEIPLQLEVLFQQTEAGFYRGRFNFGTAYARLINVKAISSTLGNISASFDEVPPNVFLFHLGSAAFINEHFAINGKGTLSIHGKWTLAIRGLWMF